MKQINTYISEKLSINKNTKITKYHPKSLEELKNIIINEKDGKRKRVLDLTDIDVSKVESLSELFEDFTKLFEVNLSGWDTSNVTDISKMFNRCENIKLIDCTGWNTSNIENMEKVFQFNKKLKTVKGIEDWDTSLVKNMSFMFYSCNHFNGDLSSFDVRRVKEFVGTFAGCYNLNFDVENWKINKDANMKWMFNNCNSLNKPSWYEK